MNFMKQGQAKEPGTVGQVRPPKFPVQSDSRFEIRESLLRVVGRGEVGIKGYQPNIDAC